LNIQAPQSVPPAKGGGRIQLTAISFEGNSLFSDEQLLATIGPFKERSYDMAGLRELSGKVGAHYHRAGYPFVRAFIPEQAMADGALRIQVVEGRYGRVSTSGKGALAARAQSFLADLQPGHVIKSAALERATLLLDDLPGIHTRPVMRPGAAPGAGDLDVAVERNRPYTAEVGLDNHGNYYSGQWRTRASLDINSPFTLGDQINLRALYTQSDLWLGHAAYSLPVGSSGLRAQAAYAQTSYTLDNGFEGNEGVARITSLSLSYPLLRSQRTNVNLGAAWQYKRLYNSYFFGATSERYFSASLPLTLGFDHRDSLGGGGLTWGALGWVHGNLHKDDPVRRGAFNKYSLDLARLQALPAGLTLYLRAGGQWANKNLDSSESLVLGGPAGVRAYPTGEASGDTGWLTQVELRYAAGNFTPYVFYDHGRIKVNAKPDQVALPAPDETRAGAGFGVRYRTAAWSLDAAVAWRTRGGAPMSDTHADPKPRFWLSAGYKF
jgi:hemolysin activation/secretion protein